MKWYVAQKAGIINLKDFIQSQGLLFPNAGTSKGIYKSEAIKLIIFDRWGK